MSQTFNVRSLNSTWYMKQSVPTIQHCNVCESVWKHEFTELFNNFVHQNIIMSILLLDSILLFEEHKNMEYGICLDFGSYELMIFAFKNSWPFRIYWSLQISLIAAILKLLKLFRPLPYSADILQNSRISVQNSVQALNHFHEHTRTHLRINLFFVTLKWGH